ncbi:phosphatidylethanolamine-binding protein, partial [Clohesyomyces aquaticus]
AQTAPGFPLQGVSQTLNVSYGSNVVSPPGELIPRPEVANPPTISSPTFTPAGKAVLFMVDTDVPRNGTRIQLLHWLVSNVTLSAGNGTSGALSIPSTAEATYRQPSPPVGDIPHHYTFVLYPQPADFAVPAQFTDILQTRAGFNFSAFVAAAGLSNPLAANYIQVQNLTGVSGTATTFPPPAPTVSPTSSGPAQFPGAAARTAALGGGKLMWAGVATAMVVGVAAFAL